MSRFCLRTVRLVLVLSICAAAGAGAEDERHRVESGVSAFYSGLAALEMGLFERAGEDLRRAAEVLPEEPAVWADLGVLAMRRGDDAKAREHLRKARALAPENAHVALLLGLLARRQGDTQAALSSMRRAVELDPSGLKARYALATALEEADAGNAGRVLELIAGLLADDPGNLALRIKQVRLLAGAGKAGALADVVAGLEDQAGDWPASARSQLQALAEVADDPQEAGVRAAVLRNVLLRTPDFQKGLARVQVPAQLGGEPLERLVKTPVPDPAPAEPDWALAFEKAPLPEDAPGMLVLPAGGPGAVLRVPGDVEVALPGPAVDGPLASSQALAVDLANDGVPDIVLATQAGLRIFERQPGGTFAEAEPGLDAAVRGGAYRGAWAADLEMDGDLDLVLGAENGPPVVLQNDADGSFTRRDLFQSVDGLRALVWADLDADGVPDVGALDAGGTVHRFHNARSWTYDALETMQGSHIAIAAADLTRDGRMELVTLAADGTLAAAGGAGRRGRWEAIPADLAPGQAALFTADLDNNGALDLLATAAGESAAWLTGVDGAQRLLDEELPWHVAAVADLNGDGRLDLVGLDDEGRVLRLVGTGERSYGWQAVRPRALENAGDNRINSLGLGGQVALRAGLLVQRQVIDGPVVHFGLGEQARADVAWILWPNGTSQAAFDLEPRRTVDAVQRLKGSCPWVFAHDGEGFRFITDFLWRSPLGMRINTVATATQTEDWVRIPGEALAEVDGHYEVRITAELWETHFIDAVSLLAVDHDPDETLFVDESFSRQAPLLKPILTTPPRPVGSVVDDAGRDWTDEARELDSRYVAGLDLGHYQGIARPHHLEIDLGEAEFGEHPVLVASGWVYPTDSSINVAIEQGERVRPRGLRLEVPDGAGGWTVARADLGFPSGKTKTMVIDLDGVFMPGTPRRLRLATNLEVYWDRLALAERRPETRAATHRLDADTARLQFRGYSETSQPSREMPEVPRYHELQGTVQRWPDLAGYHTRFGDVRELLAGVDDRYVIMKSGDELVLRFEAPPPADGLERDFILVGDGWVKDGDYNTAFSRTVLPLPSHGQSGYDTPPTVLEDDPVYQRHADDWRRYHTRYVTPARFLTGLR